MYALNQRVVLFVFVEFFSGTREREGMIMRRTLTLDRKRKVGWKREALIASERDCGRCFFFFALKAFSSQYAAIQQHTWQIFLCVTQALATCL